jgi:hypothetical protein
MTASQRVHDGFGNSHRDIADINQGQIFQEEKHGGLEMLVYGGDGDNEKVRYQCCQVNQEEEHGT